MTTIVSSLINSLVEIVLFAIGGLAIVVSTVDFSTSTLRIIFPSPTITGVTFNVIPASLSSIEDDGFLEI